MPTLKENSEPQSPDKFLSATQVSRILQKGLSLKTTNINFYITMIRKCKNQENLILDSMKFKLMIQV